MKKLILSAALLAASLASQAQQGPLWMRYPAISPDGSTIAFAYKGDLYCVPAQGGEARQLTTNAAYDSQPIWSPDGKKIAFTSNREGSLDVYVISTKGGAPTRLTTNSGKETPIAFKDNDHVLFSANIMPTTRYGLPTTRASTISASRTVPSTSTAATSQAERIHRLRSRRRILYDSSPLPIMVCSAMVSMAKSIL